MFASMFPDPSPFRFGEAVTIELVLRDADGAPWILSLSTGMEKFIGAYPRLDRFGGEGPLLVFRAAGQPA
jgi:hypothetical protein